jgi:hypothetical protein
MMRHGRDGRGMARRLAACIAMIPLSGAAVMGAQSGRAGGASAGPAATKLAPATRPAYTRVQQVPDDLFDRSRRPVILLPAQPGEVGQDPEQRSEGTRKRLSPDVPLLPEGYVVASREAKVDKQGDWYVLQVSKAKDLPDSPPLRALPNRELAMLQAVLAQSNAAPAFLVTGRVTEFLGANYILIEDVEEVVPPAAGEAVPEETAEPGSTSAPSTGGREPTAEEILKKLMSKPTRRSVALPQLRHTIGPEVKPAGVGEGMATRPEGVSGTLPEESLLVDRVGRVLPGEKWWTFVFENKGEQAADKPIRLLPNRLLESAISLSKGGTQGTVFLISGELTTYENVNYLLLHKVLLRRNLGNIR